MTPSWFNPLFLFSVWLALFSNSVSAQSFNWTFINLSQGLLEECHDAQISLSTDSNNPLTPPYYMFAYEEAGPTTVTNLGSNVANLSWQVNHPSGTYLLLTIIDSKGNSGGVSPEPYFVLSTTDSSCHEFVSPVVTLQTNLTETVETCAPIEFIVSGGQKPYTGSIVISGESSVLNFTMGPLDDTLIWYTRASPAQPFVFSVSDARGRYAFSTSSGVSSGSGNIDCGSLPAALQFSSSGGHTSVFPKPTSTASNANTTSTSGSAGSPTSTPTMNPTSPAHTGVNEQLADTKKKTNVAAIVGGVIGGALVLALVLLIYYCFMRRHRKPLMSLDGTPVESENQMVVTPFVAAATSTDASSRSRMMEVGGGMPVTNSPSVSSSDISGRTKMGLLNRELPVGSPLSEVTHSIEMLPVRQHVDIADVSPGVVDLPPAYSNRPPLREPSFGQAEEAMPRRVITNK